MNDLPRIGGGVDLSALVRKANTPAAPAPEVGSAGGPTGLTVKVPSLVIDGNAETLAALVKMSETVPVLVVFTSERTESSKMLAAKMANEVTRRGGATVLLRLDGDKNPQLVKTFQMESLPAVAAILKGRPAPLFAGDQEPAAIAQVIDRMLEVAAENGITGVVQVDEDAAPPAPELPVHDAAGYAAIDAGDYALAAKEFEAALAESPADKLAVRGLAEAKYMMRVEHLDLETVLTKPAEELIDVLNKADALTAMGHFDKAFEALLDTFAVATKEDREVLRTHLLELFTVLTDQAPGEIALARQRLASLLY